MNHNRYKEEVARDIDIDKENARHINATTQATLAEDKAFMRKMNNIRFNDMSNDELKRVYKIALNGLYVRSNVDKLKADINRWEHEKTQQRTINHGLKYSEIYRRAREVLRGLSG